MPISSKLLLPVYFLGVLIGAAVLGPILYFGLEAIWPIPFHRAMDRALLISALAWLVLVGTRISLGKLWPLNGDAWKQLLLGYALAAVTIQAIIGFDLANGGFTVKHLGSQVILLRILLALVAAILIPPLEETLFRGFIQTELIERLGWCAGWIAAAAIYMLAHFLKVPVELDSQSIHLWSGATVLVSAFLPLTNGDVLSGKGLNLLLLGLIFGGAFLRCGTLWLNAGLHSGLIFALILFTGLTEPSPQPYLALFGGDILSSPITSVVLVLLGVWLWLFYRHPSIVPETGENAH